VIDPAALHMVLMVLTGWIKRRERHAVARLVEENWLLRRQLGRIVCDAICGSVTRAVPSTLGAPLRIGFAVDLPPLLARGRWRERGRRRN